MGDSGNIAIRCDQLTKKFGNVIALDDLSLKIEAGRVVGYLGPNGAGKTTTLRLLLGLIKPTSGSAQIFGMDVQKEKIAIHSQLSYVPGDNVLWPEISGMQTLELLGNLHGGTDIGYRDELIEKFKLDPNKKIKSYSKGNKQKVILIAALMNRSKLLVLDEPTSGLDPLMELEFRNCLKQAKDNGQTVFLSSHILSEVEAICDDVYILRDGKLVESGKLEDLKHFSMVDISIVFKQAAPDISALRGVTILASAKDSVHFKFRGDFNELLRAISNSDIRTFLASEPSLEELFISLYGK